MITKSEIIELLKKGKSVEWNLYRKRYSDWIPDLEGEDLTDIDFVPPGKPVFDLSKANLCGAKLPRVDNLSRALRTVNIQDALVDMDTTVPAEFDLYEHGAMFVTKSELSRHKATILPRSVFISYAWANEGVVLAIDQWLRLKGIDTRIDKRDFFAGSRIRDEIMRLMKESSVILIFYSKESKDKPWPEFERELASDLEMAAKQEAREPPRIMYVVIDDSLLPSVTESNRIAVMAKGKRFRLVCEEIYHNILQIPKPADTIDLDKWDEYVF